jgi:hypothetical protein
MGKFERKLDMSLVRRIKAREDGTLYIPRAEAKPIHKVKPPRDAADYRGAKRNAARFIGWPAAKLAKERPLARAIRIPLNRSSNLPPAKTYAEAAAISRDIQKAA